MDAVDALIEAIQNFKGKNTAFARQKKHLHIIIDLTSSSPLLLGLGGLLVVSHDQYFVSKTCNELWVVEEGKASRFEGTFDDYKMHTAKKTKKRVEESVKKLGNLNH